MPKRPKTSQAAPAHVQADPAAMVGHDELGLGHLLSDYAVQDLGEPQRRYLETLTKYAKAGEQAVARLDEDIDVVAVWDDKTDTVATIMRSLRELVEMPEGRTFRVYDINAVRVFGKGSTPGLVEDALQHIQDLRGALAFQVARSIDGFGVAPDPDEAEEINPLA